ncbi:helix-hairpin-helix domain-containing protein [Trichocoleus sp. FACHB-90]|uniref:helix-hairpin-helix domain-containing protein n=1 Tax=Cyanophyceae TaxID=3028117 RepID=UPI001681FF04|nr:helix-hairpin-helix domain-containing protein [Trichocoleus sp. FACHB-90]MBD1929733.1 helix-hairpin-helix domain-containing protein [Trichocoleus sp. FACHB-90]
MKFIFRFFALAFAVVSLLILSSCSQTPSTSDTSKTNTAPVASSSPVATTTHSNHGGRKININSAILSELDKLEAKLGVPALSNKVQASRPYGSTEELVSKKVISQEQFDQVKDMVTIEDVVLAGEAKDVDYMTKLGLMKGHLVVAKELLDQQKPEQAEPHIGHPVEEIYVDVEAQLQERNVKEFKTTLIGLQDLVKSKPKDAQIKNNFEASMQAVDGAIQGLPEQERQSPEFVLQVVNGLLDAANSEYGAAIANGKVSAAIEYQDSRGFVNYADQLLNNVSDQMAKENPEAQKAIASSMTELKTAWPSAVPPTAPVKTPEQVSQLVKTIEQNAQKVIK